MLIMTTIIMILKILFLSMMMVLLISWDWIRRIGRSYLTNILQRKSIHLWLLLAIRRKLFLLRKLLLGLIWVKLSNVLRILICWVITSCLLDLWIFCRWWFVKVLLVLGSTHRSIKRGRNSEFLYRVFGIMYNKKKN